MSPSALTDRPPTSPQARVVKHPRSGVPSCSACKRRVQNLDQWRCPWVACRKWFRVK